MIKPNRVLAVAMLLVSSDAWSGVAERTLSLELTVDATQDWRNELQWSKAQTRQHYRISTRLRSDGRLYADNLLDPDPARRLDIKQDFYTYQGLLELKREFGGRLPDASQVKAEISSATLIGSEACVPGTACPSSSPQRYTAIAALQSNTRQQLESFMQSYEKPGGRWLYFTGYAGCPNQIDLQYRAHFAGQQAFDHKRKNLQPFEMDRQATTQGSEEDKRRLCDRFVITYDTRAGQMYLENVYWPALIGTSQRKTNRGIEQSQVELSPPTEVMGWASAQLEKALPSGRRQAPLRLTLPLDGNSTVLGQFDGPAMVSLSWDFH
ncbi:hypothetical protein [Hydrocarboniphaga effusa]|uniref:hypothetical protein n=1 Tax=Hydrocarboniphaga effusa TaxID=243629 RepID=UPI00398C1569